VSKASGNLNQHAHNRDRIGAFGKKDRERNFEFKEIRCVDKFLAIHRYDIFANSALR